MPKNIIIERLNIVGLPVLEALRLSRFALSGGWMNRFTGPVLAALTITGCSFNYVPPIFEERNFSIKHGSKQESVLARSKKILKEEGFEIHSGDYKQGSITTVYREIK